MEYVDELTRLLGKAFLHRFTCIHILRICIVLYNKYHVVQSILGIENPPPPVLLFTAGFYQQDSLVQDFVKIIYAKMSIKQDSGSLSAEARTPLELLQPAGPVYHRSKYPQ